MEEVGSGLAGVGLGKIAKLVREVVEDSRFTISNRNTQKHLLQHLN